MCPCNSGVNGLGIDIDWTMLGVEQATEIIKRLPNENIVSIVKSLPMDVQRKICGQGVSQEVQSYIPWVIGGGAALVIAYVLMK